jgi:hypothetical protein
MPGQITIARRRERREAGKCVEKALDFISERSIADVAATE